MGFPKAHPTMPAVFIKSIAIAQDSIDVHRHVNNQEYLRWMQEIAIEHSTVQGWPMERYLDGGASWYVKSHFIDYQYPALLGDTLIACTWVADMTARRSKRCTLFLRQRDRQPIASAETQWIFVSLSNGRPMSIPTELRSAFAIIEDDTRALAAINDALNRANQATQTIG